MNSHGPIEKTTTNIILQEELIGMVTDEDFKLSEEESQHGCYHQKKKKYTIGRGKERSIPNRKTWYGVYETKKLGNLWCRVYKKISDMCRVPKTRPNENRMVTEFKKMSGYREYD
ncbi:hypothetical protein TNCV_2309241 [Trichonephila clavipes]|nr:hypothetical protein TNCV_2309241 [Trichonephila clavipes]